MNRLGIFFIFGALILSAVLTFVIYKHQKNKNLASDAARLANVNILVATKDINRGVKLQDADLAWQSWPRYAVSPSYILQDTRKKNQFLGALTRSPITAGQPITDSMLIAKANLNPLAAMLDPGMRAYTIEATLDAELAGLLQPGDVVDVVLAYSVTKPGSNEKIYQTRTILNGIKVLAIDQEITPTPPPATKSNLRPTASNSKKNVTLEVTPDEAEMLAEGKMMGTLSLSLSTIANSGNRAVGLTPKKETEESNLTLFHGEKVEKVGNE